MAKINLRSTRMFSDTVVPNKFIDEYMPEASGEFVKVYLYLLRCFNSSDTELSICQMADFFNHTEKDIVRALKYWERQKLLVLDYDRDKRICGICLNDISSLNDDYGSTSTCSDNGTSLATNDSDKESSDTSTITNIVESNITPAKISKAAAKEVEIVASATKDNIITKEPINSASHEYSLDEIRNLKKDPNVEELLFVIETYLRSPLSPSDVNFVLFWYDELKFSQDLIVYLVEYCISKNHTSLRYMDRVAIAWANNNITTVEQAQESVSNHSKVYYGVLKAFGISGRNLADNEKVFIDKWTKEFGYDLDIIVEACNRTIATTHQPEFKYADSILTNWHTKNVTSLSDVSELDDAFNKKKAQKAKESAERIIPSKKPKNLVNFDQRKYDEDYLENVLLNSSAQ